MTPKLTQAEELRDVLEATVRVIGEHYIALVAPNLLKRIARVLANTETPT